LYPSVHGKKKQILRAPSVHLYCACPLSLAQQQRMAKTGTQLYLCPPLSRYKAAFAVAQAQEGLGSAQFYCPCPGLNLGSQPETHTKRQATQHGCLSRFTEARTETDKIKDDSKIKRETNLDGHGLRPIPNVCHLPDPPWFSSQTTLNGRFLIFDFSTFVQKVFVDVNRWLIAIVCQADYGLNFSIIKAYIRNFSLQ